jgi:hypothetical protein
MLNSAGKRINETDVDNCGNSNEERKKEPFIP